MTKPQTRRIRRRSSMNLAYETIGGKPIPREEGKVIALEVSRAFRERQEQARLSKRAARVEALPPQRRSVERAMLAVEEAFVRAMWVLQRGTSEDRPVGFSGNTGLNYLAEHVDLIGQAVANGGWLIPEPRPAIPASKEITAAENCQLWLRYLAPLEARVLTVGAMSKRGDAGRRVNWIRVRSRLPELKDMPERTLRHTYTSALRNIVSHLTAERMA